MQNDVSTRLFTAVLFVMEEIGNNLNIHYFVQEIMVHLDNGILCTGLGFQCVKDENDTCVSGSL